MPWTLIPPSAWGCSARSSRVLALLFQEGWKRVVETPSLADRRTYLRELVKIFLRVNSASYYLVALESGGSVVARVPDITQFSQEWEVLEVQAFPNRPQDGQAYVYFRFLLRRKEDGLEEELGYRVEIRWSHGQFRGNPEAKLYKRFPYRRLLERGIYLRV